MLRNQETLRSNGDGINESMFCTVCAKVQVDPKRSITMMDGSKCVWINA